MDLTMVTRSDDVTVPAGAHWAVINTVTPAGDGAHAGRTMRTLVAVRGLPYVHVDISGPLPDDGPVFIEWLFERDQIDQIGMTDPTDADPAETDPTDTDPTDTGAEPGGE